MRTFKIDKTETQCVVTWRHWRFRDIPLLLFFALLTVACVALTRDGFDGWGEILAAWTIWSGIFVWVANTLFGKTRLVLDEDGLETVWTCLTIKREKNFDLADIRRFETEVRRRKKSTTYLLRVVLQEDGNEFRCPSRRTELDNLCEQLNAFLKILKTGTAPETANVSAQCMLPAPMVFELKSSSPQYLEPPPESRWHYQVDEFKGFGFRFRDTGERVGLIVLIIIAAIWNGIVSVYALKLIDVLPAPKDGEWWSLFFTVLPFAFVGLIIFGGAIYAFLELLRRTTWMFSFGEATFRTARLLPAWAVHQKLTGWNSLVVSVVRNENMEDVVPAIRNEKDDKPDGDVDLREFYEGSKYWQLAFLHISGEQLLAIDGLSKPEALWMADVILREQRTIS